MCGLSSVIGIIDVAWLLYKKVYAAQATSNAYDMQTLSLSYKSGVKYFILLTPEHTLERSLVSIWDLQFNRGMQDIYFPINTNPNIPQDNSSQKLLLVSKRNINNRHNTRNQFCHHYTLVGSFASTNISTTKKKVFAYHSPEPGLLNPHIFL